MAKDATFHTGDLTLATFAPGRGVRFEQPRGQSTMTWLGLARTSARVYQGVPDPRDPTRLTFRVVLDGTREGELAGRLTGDPDEPIRFEMVRDPPPPPDPHERVWDRGP